MSIGFSGVSWDFMGFMGFSGFNGNIYNAIYPSVNIQKAMENHLFN
jgi:hypothetical protein